MGWKVSGVKPCKLLNHLEDDQTEELMERWGVRCAAIYPYSRRS